MGKNFLASKPPRLGGSKLSVPGGVCTGPPTEGHQMANCPGSSPEAPRAWLPAALWPSSPDAPQQGRGGGGFSQQSPLPHPHQHPKWAASAYQAAQMPHWPSRHKKIFRSQNNTRCKSDFPAWPQRLRIITNTTDEGLGQIRAGRHGHSAAPSLPRQAHGLDSLDLSTALGVTYASREGLHQGLNSSRPDCQASGLRTPTL